MVGRDGPARWVGLDGGFWRFALQVMPRQRTSSAWEALGAESLVEEDLSVGVWQFCLYATNT